MAKTSYNQLRQLSHPMVEAFIKNPNSLDSLQVISPNPSIVQALALAIKNSGQLKHLSIVIESTAYYFSGITPDALDLSPISSALDNHKTK